MLRKKSGETIRSCTMIITEPNRFVAEVHDRMPALLRPEQFDAWLDGSAGKEVLCRKTRSRDARCRSAWRLLALAVH